MVNACLSVLRDVQRSSYDNITDNWKSMDPESVCAFINDSHRMMEKCNEFSEQILDMIPQTDHREMLSAMAEAVSKEYITLAHTGVTFLSRCILEDLEDAVFGCLFTVDWENDVDNHPLSSMVCATLNDYMSDIEQWLGGSYCERFIEDVLVQVVVAYIMSIRKQAHDTYQFKSEFVAARGMIVDSEQFKTFFHKLLSDREKTKAEMMEDSGQDEDGEYNDMGYESSSSYQANVVRIANLVKGSIEPITQLARVVSATHITGAEDDVKHLYGRYHGDGLKAVIAAIQCNPSMNTQEKRENMETAIKIFTTGGSGNRNGSGFSSVCSDAFKNIDAIPFDAATPITRISAVGAEDDNRRSTFTRAKSRMTWGRRKQNDA